MVYLPVQVCQVIDTWHVMGMRGTGVMTCGEPDVFVPTARTFPSCGVHPGSPLSGLIYRFPLVGTVGPICRHFWLAVARCAIEEVSRSAQGKVPVAAKHMLRDGPRAAKVAQRSDLARGARIPLRYPARDVGGHRVAGETLSLRHKADVLLAMTHAVRVAVAAVELIVRRGGHSGVYTRSRWNASFRDVQVCRHHAFGAETRYETGRAGVTGSAPGLPGLAF